MYRVGKSPGYCSISPRHNNDKFEGEARAKQTHLPAECQALCAENSDIQAITRHYFHRHSRPQVPRPQALCCHARFPGFMHMLRFRDPLLITRNPQGYANRLCDIDCHLRLLP